MRFAQSGSANGAFSLLWTRAPWWRFSLMSAALLTLLCVLFPPSMAPNIVKHVPALINEASYTPPVVAREAPPPISAAVPKSAAATLTPSKPHVQAPVPPPSAVTPARPAKATPQVAELSLATPGNNVVSKDTSGLDAAVMGRTYHDSLLVNGFKLPLPPGNWVMLANSSIHVTKDPSNTGMNYFLGRIERKRLVGAVIIYAMKSPGSGFAGFNRCDTGNIYTAKEEITPFDHQACWNIHTYFTPPWQQWADKTISINGIERAAAGDMAAKGVTYPQDMISVQLFRSEKWGLLEASYVYNPESEGITSNVAPTFRDADWFGSNLQHYPEKIAYVNKLKDWGGSFWSRFKIAFEEAVPVGTPPLATPRAAPEPIAAYTSQVSQIIARSVRQVRVEQELAKVKETGHPVALPTGTCSALIAVNADGTIRHAELAACSSDLLGEVELAAIKRAAPLPPPGQAQTITVSTYAPVATPGVNGN